MYKCLESQMHSRKSKVFADLFIFVMCIEQMKNYINIDLHLIEKLFHFASFGETFVKIKKVLEL